MRNLRTLPVVSACVTCLFGQAAFATAIAISSGKVVTTGVIAGAPLPSAVCAGTQIGNFGVEFDGVVSCSNASQYRSKPFPILNAADTRKVGAGVKKVFPQGYAGQTNLQAGQNFLYNRKVSLGKANINTSASSTSPSNSKAKASAFQFTILGTTIGAASANYTRVRFEPLAGLGVGVVNDPFQIKPESLGSPGTISVYMGSNSNGTLLPSLQASEPGDYASETYDLEINGKILFDLGISIDSSTTSKLGATYSFDAFDAADLGYANQSDFLYNYLLPDLTFDPGTHTLSQIAPLLLNQDPLLVSDTTEVTFNYTAEAGGAAPEPSSTFGLAAALMGLAVAGWRKRR